MEPRFEAQMMRNRAEGENPSFSAEKHGDSEVSGEGRCPAGSPPNRQTSTKLGCGTGVEENAPYFPKSLRAIHPAYGSSHVFGFTSDVSSRLPFSFESRRQFDLLTALYGQDKAVCFCNTGGRIFPAGEWINAKSLDQVPPWEGVYTFYADGRPLYIGKSDNLLVRIVRHKIQFHDDWCAFWPRVRRVVEVHYRLNFIIGEHDQFEAKLIAEHQPPFNRHGVCRQNRLSPLPSPAEVQHGH